MNCHFCFASPPEQMKCNFLRCHMNSCVLLILIHRVIMCLSLKTNHLFLKQLMQIHYNADFNYTGNIDNM